MFVLLLVMFDERFVILIKNHVLYNVFDLWEFITQLMLTSKCSLNLKPFSFQKFMNNYSENTTKPPRN